MNGNLRFINILYDTGDELKKFRIVCNQFPVPVLFLVQEIKDLLKKYHQPHNQPVESEKV